MVPGLEASGFVAPRMTIIMKHQYCLLLARELDMKVGDIPRPVLTASRPSQTIAQIGPLNMSTIIVSASLTVCNLQCVVICGWRRTCDEALEKRLVGQIFIVLLEVLLGGSDELDCSKLVPVNRISLEIHSIDTDCTMDHLPTLLKARDDIADKSTLYAEA